MKKFVLILALALCATVGGTALAATATGTLQIAASVAAAGTCTVNSTSLGFGVITPPISANIDQFNTLTLNCPSGTPYTIALSTGLSGDFTQRKMAVAGDTSTLDYNLYADAAYSMIWGEDIGPAITVSGVGTGAITGHQVYARVPAQATPPPGDYLDTVTITVTY